MRMKIVRFSIFITVLVVGLLMIPIWASADLIFNLGTGNSDISAYSGPYAQVDVHLTDSTHATITFKSLTNSGNIYLLGDGSSAAVNVNASSWTLGSIITGSNAGTGFTPGPWSGDGSKNVDGFGVFNQTIKSDDGFTSSSDTISFSLTDNSGTWADAGSVLTGNADGWLAAAHIFVTSSPANAENGAVVTGFASGVTQVPEPGTILLLITGLLGLAVYGRMKIGTMK